MLVLFTRDFLFSSKISGTARLLEIPLKVLLSLTDWPACRDDTAHPVTGILLDLSAGISPTDLMAQVPDSLRSRTMAFGAHVDTQQLAAARAAGFPDVWPRSRLAAELPALLQRLHSSE